MEELEKNYYTLVYKAYINKERIFELVETPVVMEYLELIDEHMLLDYELKKSIKQDINNYENIKKQLDEITLRMSKLMKDSLIVEYNDKMKKQTVLDYELKKVDFNLKKQLRLNCDHLFVNYASDKRGVNIYCCLKCGLDTKLKSSEFKPVSSHEYQKYDITHSDNFHGIKIDEYTDLKLANSIYEGITKKYPDVSTDDLAKYFRVARHFIVEKGEANYDKHVKHLGIKNRRGLYAK